MTHASYLRDGQKRLFLFLWIVLEIVGVILFPLSSTLTGKTELRGNYYHCIAIITYRFFSLRLSEVRYVSRFVSLQRLVVVLRLNSAEALL